MKTRRGALSLGCSVFSAARSAATSGRSCSAACRVFFEGDVMTVEEATDRADAGLLPSLKAQPRADLLQCQVRLRSDQVDEPLFVLLQRRAAVAGACPSDRRHRSKYVSATRPVRHSFPFNLSLA